MTGRPVVRAGAEEEIDLAVTHANSGGDSRASREPHEQRLALEGAWDLLSQEEARASFQV